MRRHVPVVLVSSSTAQIDAVLEAAAVELGMTGVVYGGPADLAAALGPLPASR
ncbi:hypothetical protein [Planobispora takensis]|uniref:Uncharacterized protein n=1 Tax=Planobispora takensis TaxID=1367882 RepID=A0A8J3ST09_9ACTN|nr:hypothetical protein [Planobispora takensis]GIH98185.1 hypothetical protein Pta02_01940 [Planobispora takensis]